MAFREKLLSSLPPIEAAGRHYKRYYVTSAVAVITAEVEKAALELLPELVPEMDGTPPAGFVVLHRGGDGAAYMNAYTWVWVNVPSPLVLGAVSWLTHRRDRGERRAADGSTSATPGRHLLAVVIVTAGAAGLVLGLDSERGDDRVSASTRCLLGEGVLSNDPGAVRQPDDRAIDAERHDEIDCPLQWLWLPTRRWRRRTMPRETLAATAILCGCYLVVSSAQRLDSAREAIDSYRAAIQLAQREPSHGQLESAFNAI